MINPKTGDHFVKALIQSGMIPDMVVTLDPFLYRGDKSFKYFFWILKRKISYLFNRSIYINNYFPFFIAKKCKIPIWPSQLVNTKAFRKKLLLMDVDYIFVFTFRLLKKSIFSIPKSGTINCHPSLLPGHRGANPFFWSVLAGEKETGITFHYIDKGIDTGRIICQYKIPLGEYENSQILQERLFKIGSNLFIKIIVKLLNGEKINRIQYKINDSYEKPPNEEDRLIKLSYSYYQIDRIVKASVNCGFAILVYQGENYFIIDSMDATDSHPLFEGSLMVDKFKNFYLKTKDKKVIYLVNRKSTPWTLSEKI
jgi:methionyl-tRNA formyltransferase